MPWQDNTGPLIWTGPQSSPARKHAHFSTNGGVPGGPMITCCGRHSVPGGPFWQSIGCWLRQCPGGGTGHTAPGGSHASSTPLPLASPRHTVPAPCGNPPIVWQQIGSVSMQPPFGRQHASGGAHSVPPVGVPPCSEQQSRSMSVQVPSGRQQPSMMPVQSAGVTDPPRTVQQFGSIFIHVSSGRQQPCGGRQGFGLKTEPAGQPAAGAGKQPLTGSQHDPCGGMSWHSQQIVSRPVAGSVVTVVTHCWPGGQLPTHSNPDNGGGNNSI